MKQWSVSLRPTKLNDVYGCDNVKKFFAKAGKEKEYPNAILLSGLYGSGKTTVAKILAAQMTCTRPNDDGTSCNTCENCKSVLNETYNRGSVKFIDGSQASKDDVITELSDYVQGAPFNSPRKVVLIDEAQELSTSAAKSLLKLLETPKKNLHFILTSMGNSDQASKGTGKEVPRSIISRCQQFNFKRQSTVEIMVYLKTVLESQELWTTVPNEFKMQGLQMIADNSMGSIRQALQTLEQCITTESYTPQEISDNLGIEDMASYNDALLQILDGKNNDAVLNLLTNVDPNSIFNLLYKMVSDAVAFSVFGKLPSDSQYYGARANELAQHPNFICMKNVFQNLAEKSNPYLKKGDYIIAICDLIKMCKNNNIKDEATKAVERKVVRRV